MSSALLYRASGLALLLGALLGIIGTILSCSLPGNDPHQYLTPLWVVVTLVGFLGSLLLLLGLPRIPALQAARAGWLGFTGFILTFIGGFLFTSFSVVGLLVLPWLAQVAPTWLPEVDHQRSLSSFSWQATVCSGRHSARLRRYAAGVLATLGWPAPPDWCAPNLVTFPLNGILASIIGTVAFVLFAGGLGWMGYALMSARSMEAVQPTTPSTEVGG